MTKKDLENILRKYVENHAEMQEKEVTYKALEDCAKECKCAMFYVMMFLRYGRL